MFDAYLHNIISWAHEKAIKNGLDLMNVLIVGDVNLPGIDWSLLSNNNAYEKNVLSGFSNIRILFFRRGQKRLKWLLSCGFPWHYFFCSDPFDIFRSPND